ncbi:MAG: hypothetical protein RIF32_05290, partial [Leptospirales bacterium]
VASDIPCFHEIGGEYVRYLPADDVDAWAAALEEYTIVSPPTAPKKNKAGRTVAPVAGATFPAGEWGWDRTAAIYHQEFLRLLEPPTIAEESPVMEPSSALPESQAAGATGRDSELLGANAGQPILTGVPPESSPVEDRESRVLASGSKAAQESSKQKPAANASNQAPPQSSKKSAAKVAKKAAGISAKKRAANATVKKPKAIAKRTSKKVAGRSAAKTGRKRPAT